MRSSTKTGRPGTRKSNLVGLVAIAASFSTVILILPVAFLLFGGYSDSQLVRLSNLGQTYGAVSAVLSALAVGGVAASIVYQARQEHAQRLDGLNRTHFELVSLLISDPETFTPCVIDPAEFESPQQMKQYWFSSLWLNTTRTMYELGEYSEVQLRNEIIGDMTRSSLARQLWKKRRAYILAQLDELPPFHRMADEEFSRNHSLPTAEPQRGPESEA